MLLDSRRARRAINYDVFRNCTRTHRNIQPRNLVHLEPDCGAGDLSEALFLKRQRVAARLKRGEFVRPRFIRSTLTLGARFCTG